LLLLRFGNLWPYGEKSIRNRSFAPIGDSISYYQDDSLSWHLGSLDYQAVMVQDSSNNMRLVFQSSSSFIEYFRYQYDEQELTRSLQNAGHAGQGALIEVQPRKNKSGNNFDQQYRVKVRFAIKPVPKP
jgi:hypothetical protein